MNTEASKNRAGRRPMARAAPSGSSVISSSTLAARAARTSAAVSSVNGITSRPMPCARLHVVGASRATRAR